MHIMYAWHNHGTAEIADIGGFAYICCGIFIRTDEDDGVVFYCKCLFDVA